MSRAATAMNAWQRAVCKTYGHGDFDHFADDPDWRQNLDACGDTLFMFLMIELGDMEDCGDARTALQRLHTARDDINEAIAAVSRLAWH